MFLRCKIRRKDGKGPKATSRTSIRPLAWAAQSHAAQPDRNQVAWKRRRNTVLWEQRDLLRPSVVAEEIAWANAARWPSLISPRYNAWR
jgi:hypothetical protein